jgi:hypothetical protein
MKLWMWISILMPWAMGALCAWRWGVSAPDAQAGWACATVAWMSLARAYMDLARKEGGSDWWR